MYSPKLAEDKIRALYRVARAYRKPMTTIADKLITMALVNVDKARVCNECHTAGNTDCRNCLLADIDSVADAPIPAVQQVLPA